MSAARIAPSRLARDPFGHIVRGLRVDSFRTFYGQVGENVYGLTGSADEMPRSRACTCLLHFVDTDILARQPILQSLARVVDHFVGERVQFQRDVEPQRPGGLEVDDELELGRLFDG